MTGTAPLTGDPSKDYLVLAERIKELKDELGTTKSDLRCDLSEMGGTLKQFISDWHASRLEAVKHQGDLSHNISVAMAFGKENREKIEKLEKDVKTQTTDHNNLVLVVEELRHFNKLFVRGLSVAGAAVITYLVVHIMGLI